MKSNQKPNWQPKWHSRMQEDWLAPSPRYAPDLTNHARMIARSVVRKNKTNPDLQ